MIDGPFQRPDIRLDAIRRVSAAAVAAADIRRGFLETGTRSVAVAVDLWLSSLSGNGMHGVSRRCPASRSQRRR